MDTISKETKKAKSNFGGKWTEQKLEIIEKYFGAYTKIMKSQSWAKIVYIDAFAGSGEINLPDFQIKGSPLIALQYDFSKYYFIESDNKKIDNLKEYVKNQYPQKFDKIEFINGDCNTELPKIFDTLSADSSTRGVLFLDPFALELKWNVLEQAKKTKLDIFYWFPMMANRLMSKDKNKINSNFKERLNTLFGNEDWESLYKENPQINFLGEVTYIKEPINELIKYIAERMKTTFEYAPSIKLFKNSLNSPLFLLCGMTTNKSESARNLVKKLATEIFNKIDTNKKAVK
jgi:three-Cys-motif partner protein